MYRGTKDAIIEVGPEAAGKLFVWKKIAPNGSIVCLSGAPFDQRRYAAVAGHREYPELKVLHRYGDHRLDHEADTLNGNGNGHSAATTAVTHDSPKLLGKAAKKKAVKKPARKAGKPSKAPRRPARKGSKKK